MYNKIMNLGYFLNYLYINLHSKLLSNHLVNMRIDKIKQENYSNLYKNYTVN